MTLRFAILTSLLLICPAPLPLSALAINDVFLAVQAAPTGKGNVPQQRAFATPVQHAARAQAPPTGAKTSKTLSFNTASQWKRNPATHTVFTIDSQKQIWFIDPTSGWPYTLDSRGIVYTANAISGNVYSVGHLSAWPGRIPYFFQNWSYSAGMYTVPSLNIYLDIYLGSSSRFFPYDESYSEVWQYHSYFESTDFSSQTMELEKGEDIETNVDNTNAAERDKTVESSNGSNEDNQIERNNTFDTNPGFDNNQGAEQDVGDWGGGDGGGGDWGGGDGSP